MKRPHSNYHNKIYITSEPQEQYKNNILKQSLPNSQYNNYFNNYNKELEELENTWDDLGVTKEYKIFFLTHANKINSFEKKDTFIQERKDLKQFIESLLSLKNEISNRKESIFKLRDLDLDLEICIKSGNDNKSKNNILQQVISIIKNLRLNAINIVEKTIKINQILSYYSNLGKWDITRMNHSYSYDPYYIFKMTKDLLFLKNSIISNYIEMNNSEIDCFLTNCAPSPNRINKSDKIEIPISEDIMKMITKSRIALFQETDFTNVDKDNNTNKISRRNYFYGGNSKKGLSDNILKYSGEEKFNLNNLHYEKNGIDNIFNVSTKKKIYLKGYSLNKSKFIYNLKESKKRNNYNNLFIRNTTLSNSSKLNLRNRILNSNPNYTNYNKFNKTKITNLIRDIKKNFRQNKIQIEHELQPLSNKDPIERLSKYDENKESQIYLSKIKNEEDEKRPNNELEKEQKNELEKQQNDELEKLKEENKDYEEEIRDLKKNRR